MTNELRRARTGGSTALLTVIVVIAVLYFARVVFIPIALAILLTFMLAPLVTRLRRAGLGRVIAAGVVLTLTSLLLIVFAGAMTLQLGELAREIPGYEANVRKKIDAIRSSHLMHRFVKVVRDVNQELAPAEAPADAVDQEKPVPVQIRGDAISPLDMAHKVIGPAVNLFLMAAIVIVFLIFMLIQREDLRDRVIRLAGETRVNVTTQLLDDAARRVSRYLLAQFSLNVVFGVIAAIGLYFIGVPNPLLWGMLAVLLRYVPYLGIWVAALLPVAVAFAVEPGWVKVPAIFALYFGIDLLVINFAEPLVYGGSTGVSPIAILVAAVFWTWLWGPVGLLLATPLTVCVVVLGRYVPRLHFLSVLLSDERVLSCETRFYQRLLAMDLDEATEIAEEYLKGRSLEDLYDSVVIPALRFAEEERHRGLLDERRQKFIFQNTGLLIEDVAERADHLAASPAGAPEQLTAPAVTPRAEAPSARPMVLCIPARDEADALAARMLMQLLGRKGIEAQCLPLGALASEAVEAVEREGARIACVAAIPPFGFMHTRYLCRRLQIRFKQLKTVAVILTEGDLEELRKHQPALVADDVVVSLKQGVASVTALLPVANDSHNGQTALNAA